MEIHEDFIQSCFDRLKASYDTLCVLDGDKDSINCARQEAIRMVRVLTVLKEYINECDSDYHEERTILPMSRYAWRRRALLMGFERRAARLPVGGYDEENNSQYDADCADLTHTVIVLILHPLLLQLHT